MTHSYLKNSQHLIRYLLSFAVFLVVQFSLNRTTIHKKVTPSKQKSIKKISSNTSRAGSARISKKGSPANKALTQKKLRELEEVQHIKKSDRPEDEVVTYNEIDFELKEITADRNQVLIGPQSLTRFERARITGARSLQLSLGAPSLIMVPDEIKDSVSLAATELHAKALPISIRRVLPNGLYQDIPIDWLK